MSKIKALALIAVTLFWVLPPTSSAKSENNILLSDINMQSSVASVIVPIMDTPMVANYEVANQLYEESKKPQPKPKAKVQPKVNPTPRLATAVGQQFPGGWCTSYVASKTIVVWRGNANQWIANSKAAGAVVDKNPTVGAILVTNESRLGHVAYIEAVNGSKVTISEMNYKGRYKKSTRTLDISDKKIKGIIHY